MKVKNLRDLILDRMDKSVLLPGIKKMLYVIFI